MKKFNLIIYTYGFSSVSHKQQGAIVRLTVSRAFCRGILTLATNKYKLNDKQQVAALGALVRVQKRLAIELLGKLVATKTFLIQTQNQPKPRIQKPRLS